MVLSHPLATEQAFFLNTCSCLPLLENGSKESSPKHVLSTIEDLEDIVFLRLSGASSSAFHKAAEPARGFDSSPRRSVRYTSFAEDELFASTSECGSPSLSSVSGIRFFIDSRTTSFRHLYQA
jgi:hypothetical protein